MIDFDGIENYTFEIIKTVQREELNYWEDYYILLYNTMYPNGYNKKWNTSEEIRKTMKVVPIQNIQEITNIIKQENEELTEEELQQLNRWKKLRKDWENGKIVFFDYYNDPFVHNNVIPGIKYIHAWEEEDFMQMPRSQYEFKERKKEVQEKEQILHRPTQYKIDEKVYLLKSSNFTKAKKDKCEDLIKSLYRYNTSDNLYYLNEYGAIKMEKFHQGFVVDTIYNCLAKHFGNGHDNAARKTWIEIFESGAISRENIKTGTFCIIPIF